MIWLYFIGVVAGLGLFYLSTYPKKKVWSLILVVVGMFLTLTMYGLLTMTLDHKI